MKQKKVQNSKSQQPLWRQRIAWAGLITVAIQFTFIYVKYGTLWRAYEFTFWIEFTFTFFYFLALFWIYPKISGFVHSPLLKQLRSLQVNVIEAVIVVLSTLILTLVFKFLPMALLLALLNFMFEDMGLAFDNDAVRRNFIVHALIGLLMYYFVERERIRKQIQAEHLRYARLQREEFKSQLENLKNQVNPHFLFSSLKTLDSLIEKNPEGAVEFVNRLSYVYRSFLDREEELVSLRKEKDLAEAYNYILKARFGDNLRLYFSISPESLSLKLPPGSLQMLIEDAVLDNEIGAGKPLHINIGTQDGKLTVRNDRQEILSKKKLGAGLKNTIKRYGYLTNQAVEIEETDKEFIVRLPLLSIEGEEGFEENKI